MKTIVAEVRYTVVVSEEIVLDLLSRYDRRLSVIGERIFALSRTNYKTFLEQLRELKQSVGDLRNLDLATLAGDEYFLEEIRLSLSQISEHASGISDDERIWVMLLESFLEDIAASDNTYQETNASISPLQLFAEAKLKATQHATDT